MPCSFVISPLVPQWFARRLEAFLVQISNLPQVRKYLLKLEQVTTTPSKFWKPNFLVLTNDCDMGVLGLCNALKKGGLMVLVQVSLCRDGRLFPPDDCLFQ